MPIGHGPGARERDRFAGDAGAVAPDPGPSTGPDSDSPLGAALPLIARQAETRRLADQDLNRRRAAFGHHGPDRDPVGAAAATTVPWPAPPIGFADSAGAAKSGSGRSVVGAEWDW
ncbi:hypothetical protein [Nocardia araoensis]|uniref:hypothetical protein n=1 Tax=Nocardia araoensis TaxID=228600 RepID=UPI00030C21F5|nr:hypothetical protein [Nocardia araoensis]